MKVPSSFQNDYNPERIRPSNIAKQFGRFQDTSSGAKRRAGKKIADSFKEFGNTLRDYAVRSSAMKEETQFREDAYKTSLAIEAHLLDNALDMSAQETLDFMGGQIERVAKEKGFTGETRDKFATIIYQGVGSKALNLTREQNSFQDIQSHNKYSQQNYQAFQDDVLPIDLWVDSSLKGIELISGGDTALRKTLLEREQARIGEGAYEKVIDKANLPFQQMLIPLFDISNPNYKNTNFDAELQANIEKLRQQQEDAEIELETYMDIIESKGMSVDRVALKNKLSDAFSKKSRLLKESKEKAQKSKTDLEGIFHQVVMNHAVNLGTGKEHTYNDVDEFRAHNEAKRIEKNALTENLTPFYQEAAKVDGVTEQGAKVLRGAYDRKLRDWFDMGVHTGTDDVGRMGFHTYHGASPISHELLSKLANINPLERQPHLRKIFLNPEHPQHQELLKELRENYELIEITPQTPDDPPTYTVRYATIAQALQSEGYTEVYMNALLGAGILRPEDIASTRRVFNSTRQATHNSELSDIYEKLRQGSMTPVEATRMIQGMDGLSFPQKEAFMKKADEYSGEAGVWVDRFFSDYPYFRNLFLKRLGTSPLPNDEGIRAEAQYKIALTKRMRAEYGAYKVQARDRGYNIKTQEEWYRGLSTVLADEITKGKFKVNLRGTESYTIPPGLEQIIESAKRLKRIDQESGGAVLNPSNNRQVRTIEDARGSWQRAVDKYERTGDKRDKQRMQRLGDALEAMLQAQPAQPSAPAPAAPEPKGGGDGK